MALRSIASTLTAFVMSCAACVSLAQSSGAGRPLPPTKICIDDICPPTAAAGTVKWNPGHYVRADEQGWIAKQASRFAVYDTIRGVPQVRGAAFIVNWGMVENARGVYDWSQVDAEINYLASMGKKAILDLWYLGFSGSVPRTPQGSDNRYIGDYLINEGCAANVSYGGYGARLDIPKCMDRWIAFIQAVAARYDANPNVESVHVAETSTSMSSQDHEALAQQWLRLPPVLSASFRRTHTVIHNNFLVSVEKTRALTASMVQNGIGMGGPDIIVGFRLPQEPSSDTWGALEIRGAGEVAGVGTFGKIDNRAQVPSSWEAQVVRPTELRPADVNAYANSMLRSNHTIWTAFLGYSPRQYGGTVEVPRMRWDGPDGVLAYLKQASSAVTNTACPLAFKGACAN